MSKSSEANLKSFNPNFLPKAPEITSVPSLAITTRGTGVAVFAVFGLYTIVLMSSKDPGTDGFPPRASRQAAGELAGACSTVAAGVIERPAKDFVIFSREPICKGIER